MSSTIQNRLVGTIILVALAVIFLPDLLSGKSYSQQDKFVKGPQRPALRPIVEPRPVSMQEIERKASSSTTDEQKISQVDEQQQQQSAPVVEDNPTQPASTENEQRVEQQPEPATIDQSLQSDTVVKQPEPTKLQNAGWVVQLGAFKSEKNVRELLDKLQAEGYRAYSQTAQTSTGKLIKVFVGPEIDKQTLQKAIPHLKATTKLQGKLVQFSGQ